MTKLTNDCQEAWLESRRRGDIIVIGASAAALNALPVLLAALQATAPVAVFVVVGGSFRKRDRLELTRTITHPIPMRRTSRSCFPNCPQPVAAWREHCAPSMPFCPFAAQELPTRRILR